MIKASWLLVLISVAMITGACDRSANTEHYRWSINDQKDPPPKLTKFLKANAKASPEGALAVGSERIQSAHLKVGEFTVSNSWVRVVRNKKGAIVYATAQNPIKMTASLKAKLKEVAAKAPSITSDIMASYPGFAKPKEVFPAEIHLAPVGDKFVPYLQTSMIPESGDDVIRFTTDRNGTVLAMDRVGHHAAEGITSVFLETPDEKTPADVVLRNLIGDGHLNSRTLKVASDVGKSAFSKTHDFRYPTTSPNFAESQVYFFLNKFFSWLDTSHHFQLPVKLNVKVHFDGINSGNAAFYYRGNIRLGDGDGENYQSMYRDPTIVMHEAGHAVVDMLARLPTEAEGGSLSEGFSDFFSGAANDTPYMASHAYLLAPHKRDLTNTRRADEDLNGGLYHDSTIVSGTLWDIKNALGKQEATEIALATLIRLGPAAILDDFPGAVLDAAKSRNDDSQQQVLVDILTKRGWLQNGLGS